MDMMKSTMPKDNEIKKALLLALMKELTAQEVNMNKPEVMAFEVEEPEDKEDKEDTEMDCSMEMEYKPEPGSKEERIVKLKKLAKE